MVDDREQEQFRAVLDAIAADEAARDLIVEVRGHSVTVSKQDTDFSVTYEKRPDNPHLVMTHSWLEPSVTSPAVSEFRARGVSGRRRQGAGFGLDRVV